MRSRIPTASYPRRALRRPALLSLAMLAAFGAASCSTPPDPGERVKTLSQLPNRDQSLVKLGDTSRDAGDCITAVRFYRLAIDKDSESTELAAARLGLGVCELGLGDLVNADTDYREAAKLMPTNPAPMLGLGRLYLVDHKPAEAVAALDAAIKIGAAGPSPWNDKGVALDQLSRHAEAQLAYRAGLAKYPGDRPLQSNLGLSLAMSGDLVQAEALLAPLAAAPGATARNRQNLALVLGLKGEESEARDLSRRDLDGAAVDNNMRYYQRVRSDMAGHPAPSSAPMEAPVRAAPRTPVAASVLPSPPIAVMQSMSEPKAKPVIAAKTTAPQLVLAAPADLRPVDLKPADKQADAKASDIKAPDTKAVDTKPPADPKAPDVSALAALEAAPYAPEEASPQRPSAAPPAAEESMAAVPVDPVKPASAPQAAPPPPALPHGAVASSEDQTTPRAPLIAATVAAAPAQAVASP